MTDSDNRPETDTLLEQTAKIIAAYVSNNKLSTEDLPKLIGSVHKSLSALDRESEIQVEVPEPVVPIDQSIFPDYIVCLEDGKKLKMLKRHLRTSYGLSPDDYRRRWGLPPDYPMVSPNYAKRRQKLAKQIGLGKR